MRRLVACAALAGLLVAGARAWPGTGAVPASGPAPGNRAVPAFDVVEADIPAIGSALRAGRVTSLALVEAYLARIERFNPTVRAMVTLNPRAREEARALDRERTRGRVRGPLHGVPVAIKDNIQTAGMSTTGGALAFRGWQAPFEATLVTRLRAAGAVILAKTTLTELANWVAEDMPNGYNPVAGFSLNPYDPRTDPRPGRQGWSLLDTGGSSSGVGTALSLWAASVGTETSGSILSPSSQTALAGVKPTVGLISRRGVIPITGDQDTPGPMARTVTDAAILLGAMAGRDAADPATDRCAGPPRGDYTRGLRTGALRGARIGVPRHPYFDRMGPGFARAVDEALATLRRLGAEVVDPVTLPSVAESSPAENLLAWPICAGAAGRRGADSRCSTVLKYGMKRDFAAWLASLGPAAPIASLTALREWNLAHAAEGALRFGQAELDISDEVDLVRDRARYEADRARDLLLTQERGIDAVLRGERLDALVFPGVRGADIAARAGYPTVIVPMARVPWAESDDVDHPERPFPPGFVPAAVPVGLSFTGTACSEPRLLALGYAFEQATRARHAPPGAN